MGTDTEYCDVLHPRPDTAGPSSGRDPDTRQCLFCSATVSAKAAEAPDALCHRCSSPLAPAARHRLERSSRRMLRRMDRRIPVRIYVDWQSAEPILGTMRNLSLNGMRFDARCEFGANQLIRIDSEPCKALARITHCREAGNGEYSTGVEFITILFNSTRGTFVSEQA